MKKTFNYLMFACIAALLAACGGSAPDTKSSAEKAPEFMVAQHTASRTSADVRTTANVQGYKANYTLVKNNLGNVIATNKIDNTVTDLGPVTTVKFVDQSVAFDLAGNVAQVYRLYQAAFNRKPDVAGLGFWIEQYLDGMTLEQIAAGFQDSQEFKTMYGNADNRAFLTLVYTNVLHRDPDAGGLDWWVDVLNNGVSRASAMTGFSESAENKSNLNADMVNGFSYVPYTRAAGSPIQVKSSSYANAKEMNIAPQDYPKVWNNAGPYEAFTAGTAFADFLQDGKQTMVGLSNVFAGTNGKGSTVAGKVYFFQQDATGVWVDKTAQLITDRTGCISPRKVIVADFNGDGKPDVFVACHGIDGDIPDGYPQGEHPRMLLSQANSVYKNVDMGFNCYCHGATAADFNSNGYADIVAASPPVLGRLAYLKNNKDGTFTDTQALLPASTEHKSIWSLEFVDVNNDGKFDLALYGSENTIANTTPGTQPWDWQPTIFVNDGTNKFTDNLTQVKLGFTNLGDVLDIIVKDSKIAVLRAGKTSLEVQTFAYPTLAVTSMVSEPLQDTVWFTLYNGNIVGAFASNPYTVPFK